MHILQLLPSLRVGGVERGVLDLAKGLLARGHQVSVVSSGGPLVPRLTALGAAHVTLPVHEKSLASMWACVPAVESIIRSAGIDLVHARSRVPAWIGWCAARRTQRPFVTTAHGFYAPHPASRIMAQGRLVIVPSASLAQYMMERFQVPKAKLRIIPRGVDLDEFTLQPLREGAPPWRLGLIGRLSPIKGHDVAIRAMARLRQQGLDARLCIAGDCEGDPLRRSLDALAAELGVAPAIEWLGLRQDVAELLASLDVVLVPSTYPESFGRGVIEAQAVGRPVVASRLGGLAELIEDGRSGVLVRPGDPDSLADGVARLVRDPALRRACVEEGRRRVERAWSLDTMVERTLEAYEECVRRPRVLVWKLSAVGDVVLSTPSLRAVRKRFPDSDITLVVARSAYEAVARCPYMNEFLIFDRKGKDRSLRRRLALIRRLRREAFDVSVDLQNSKVTHLMAWAGGIPVRIGYDRKWGWLLNRRVRLPKVVMAPLAHQQHLLSHAGIEPDGDRLELWPSALDAQAADRLLAGVPAEMLLIGVHPGGSERWKTKRWDPERWAALIDALAERRIRVVVTGGPEERDAIETLTVRLRSQPLIVAGRTSLMELACVIKRCHVFIGHDSSPLHLAAAMGTPMVALFGPTDPRRHLPPAFRGQVIKKDVFCSPCYSPRCRTVTHACMQRIQVDEVLRTALAVLADTEFQAAAGS